MVLGPVTHAMRIKNVQHRSLCLICTASITKDVGFAGTQREDHAHVYRHQTSIASWKASLEVSCLICTMLWNLMTADQQTAVEQIRYETRLTLLFISYKDEPDPSKPLYLRAQIAIPPEVMIMHLTRLCVFVLDPREGKAKSTKI